MCSRVNYARFLLMSMVVRSTLWLIKSLSTLKLGAFFAYLDIKIGLEFLIHHVVAF